MTTRPLNLTEIRPLWVFAHLENSSPKKNPLTIRIRFAVFNMIQRFLEAV